VLGAWLLQETPNAPSERSDIGSGTGTPTLMDRVREFIKREKNDRTYKIVTRVHGYRALAFLGHKYQIGGENGQPMSSLVWEYLRGARGVNNNTRLREKNAVVNALQKLRSRAHDRIISMSRHKNTRVPLSAMMESRFDEGVGGTRMVMTRRKLTGRICL